MEVRMPKSCKRLKMAPQRHLYLTIALFLGYCDIYMVKIHRLHLLFFNCGIDHMFISNKGESFAVE